VKTTPKRKTTKRSKTASSKKHPFGIARDIATRLRLLVRAHPDDDPPPEALKYLWINVAPQCEGPECRERHEPRPLSLPEWLNVVDEASSLGICCLIVCTGDSFNSYPDVWGICRWAQEAHGIDVGIHTYRKSLDESELREMGRLVPGRTWFFVKREHLSAMRPLEQHGVKVLEAEVNHEEHSPPCDMPESMVFVGPGGVLYTCGLVLDNEQFRLGHVSEKPLARILSDPSLPRRVPKGIPHHKHGCDACPPLMAKRMTGSAR
jgi:MoaA/NifB/PqqE/SkfB family radical SAM enzyme